MSKLPAEEVALLREKAQISFFSGMFDFTLPEPAPDTQGVADTQEAEPALGALGMPKVAGTKVAPAETTLR